MLRFQNYIENVCRSPEDGMGGGDDGQSNDGRDREGGRDNQAPFELNDDAKRFMANTVNRAVSSHFKRDGFQQMLTSAVQSAMESMQQAKLEDSRSREGEERERPRANGQSGPQQMDPRDQEIAKMRAEQDRMKQALDRQTREAEEEKRKLREQSERSALTEALRSGGVDDGRMKAAVAYLYLDAKRIRRDENDNIVMSFQRDWGEELVPIDKGVAEYLKSDEGKVFVPPVETSGSGNKGGRPPRPAGQKPTRQELLQQLGNMMMRPNR